MVNLNSPAAEAVGTPNTMSDIIDSLKRLERVGSENSKTTQKLIAAATELSQLIVKYFALPGDGNCPVVDEIVDNYHFAYSIEEGRLVNLGRRHYEQDAEGDYERVYNAVDRSRDDALVFSKDIANGLLDHVIDTLEKRTAENEQGLPALEDALAKLKASKA